MSFPELFSSTCSQSRTQVMPIRLVFSLAAAFVLSVAPFAQGATSQSTGQEPSPHHRVEISSLANPSRTPFVAYSRAQKTDTNLSQDASWTSFDFSGRVTVRVTSLDAPFSRVRILPSSRGIHPRIESADTVSFEIDRPGQFAVEFDESIAHPLFIFADTPVTDAPKPDDRNVLYFGPGVHDLGEGFIEPQAGQTVFLDAGALVYGRIRLTNAPRVTICGRGILSGGHLPPNPPNSYTVPHLIEADGASHHVTVEGITLVESPHYNILLRGADCTVRNTKIIGWWYGTDGVGLGPRGLVEDCFLRCNDDALKLYHNGMVVRRCVIWQLENGAPFQLSWNLNTDNRGFRVTDCDIIHVDHHTDANNRAIFNAIHGGSGHLSDYLFENIRIENAHYRLLLLQIKKTAWAKAKAWGKISGITLRNVTADGPFRQRSAIRSDDPAGRIEDVTFENVSVGGKILLDAADAHLDLDPATTSGIRFQAN
jgi:hypothetical protein